MSVRVYLAGPDVFLPGPEAWAARKKAICAMHGLVGVSPLDDFPNEPAEWAAFPLWRRIAIRNEAHIRSCQGIIANLTPFRGPSADAGTVYELGYMAGRGKLCLGYCNDPTPYADRARNFTTVTSRNGHLTDALGLTVENFGLTDNLMMIHALDLHGCALVTPQRMPADIWHDFTAFETCVKLAAERMASQPSRGSR